MFRNQDEVRDLEGAPEFALEKGLERAANELGSPSVAVLVVEDSWIEIVYPPGHHSDARCWPATAIDGESGRVLAGTEVARFLTSAVAPTANSFLLFPWRSKGHTVIIVFGFAERQPAHQSVPEHVVESLNLAALAAWSLREVDRLRQELRTVNSRFAARKLVERAKCVLQAERGMDEQQAYEHLRKMSRQRRIPMAKLAEGLLGSPRN